MGSTQILPFWGISGYGFACALGKNTGMGLGCSVVCLLGCMATGAEGNREVLTERAEYGLDVSWE